MTEIQEQKFKEILSHFLTCQNAIIFESTPSDFWKEFNYHQSEGTRLFKEYFPERPESEIDDIMKNARGLWSNWNNVPYMTTFTGRREMWEHFF